MAILNKHPQREKINALIMSGLYSYRELQSQLLSLFGIVISHKSIHQYHARHLGGAVSNAGTNSAVLTGEPFKENTQEKTDFLNDVGQYECNIDELVADKVAEVFISLKQALTHRIKKYSEGVAPYPKQEIEHFQRITSRLLKLKKTTY